MRKFPLWRSQSDDLSGATADQRFSAPLPRMTVLALTGFGVVVAAGIGATALLSLGPQDAPPSLETEIRSDAAPAAAQAARTDARTERIADKTPVPSPSATETIDVAIARSEFDVARLEELTGMVEADPSPPAPAISRDASAMGPPPAVASGLRPAVETGDADIANAEAVEAESVPPADESAQTASISPSAAEPKEPAAAAGAAPEAALPPLSAMKVNRYVNMRAGPADEAGVITVVPSGATVQAQSDCQWCVVTYNGQRGYIYKSFLGSGGNASSGNASSSGLSGPGLY